MKHKNLSFLIALLISVNAFSFTTPNNKSDIFGIRNFIENKGQYNNSLPRGSAKVLFAMESGNENVYFTTNGPVYKIIRNHPLDEEQKERAEEGKKYKFKPDDINYVYVNWVNANENIEVEESVRQKHYFTYGGPELNAYCYKKVTYKNVYNGIDFEFEVPEGTMNGVKYNVIVHPGANVNDIKIAYSGNVKKLSLKDGNVIIKTSLDDLMEHAPASFYDNTQTVKSNFVLTKNVISFNFPEGVDDTKTLIIDPWVTNITTLNASNCGFDVDYDFFGNLFVYGGNNNTNFNPCKEAKYDPFGNLLWTFSGQVLVPAWVTGGNTNTASNFVIHKGSGKSYLGQGWRTNGGVSIIRLTAAGNYDNFITPQDPLWQECFEMGFHCGTQAVYGMGGSTNSKYSGGLVDQITGSLTAVSFNSLSPAGLSHDIASSAIDDMGAIFIHYQSSQAAMRNQLALLNPAFTNTVWMTPSTYSLSLGYFQTKAQFINPGGAVSSNAFNCLAVNANYLFYYDGFNLAAYNKTNGVKIAFITLPAHPVRSLSGIAVDDCNNLYVGGNPNILCYNFNGTNFNALASIPVAGLSVNKAVYDIKLDKGSALLYVCGSGFVGTYNAVHSNTCSAGNQFNITSNCAGFNNGSAAASVTTSLINPLINYVWTGPGGTISATYSTVVTTNTVGNLPNGIYTVQIQVNAPCGPVYVNTVNINCCANVNVVPSATQAGCSNTVNTVAITVAGGGTVVPVITWSPTPGSIAGNSLSASGLPLGTNTITLDYSFGCVTVVTVNILPSPPPVSFTINNLTGSYSITCTNPVINLQAVTNYTYGTISYTWSSPSFTANTATVNISAANTLTVYGMDHATGCLFTQTVAIGINTIAPTTTVAPLSQAITCNSGAPVTFTGTVTNPTINIQHDWYSPLNPLPGGVPIATSNNTISILTGAVPPGTYTLLTTNLVNGCSTMKTVTVTSLDAWPTFSMNSPTNYSIGCAPLNQTTLSIINPVSTQTPPSICSFTFLPPGFAGVVSPSVILGNNTSTVTQIPGTWTVIVQDNSNFCRVMLSVPVIQNTVAPNVAATILTQTLTCINPTLLATGTSSTPNTIITWGIPVAPNQLSTHTVEVGPANGPNTSTTSLTYANYTVIATNTVNACQSTSVVIVSQNFKPPVSSPTISIGTPTAIYCTVATNPVVLTTGSSTTTSGGGPLAFPVPLLWEGPSPQATMTGVSSYSAFVAGVYSLTIKDNFNGCTKTSTVNVLDKTQPPVVTNPSDTATLDCGANQATLLTMLTGTNTGLKYWYYAFPVGAAFSPSAAPMPDGPNPLLSGTTSSSVNVSMPGTYYYVVTNTLTGCRAFGTFDVKDGNITADFDALPSAGYAPLAVSFNNNSSSSLNSNSITSVWSFGNGSTQTTTTNISTSTIYNAPGTYTAVLIVSKGGCLDTTFRIINVDIPSLLEVPNVFTPNGDGSNDVFFLKTANLGEITAVIFDRWGNKVYDVTSASGNIAWDGKNLQGKEVAAGVYFYVIKAKGKDSKEYETKGNVSLYR